MYKIIWFDDECDSLNIIKEKAQLNDILLSGFSNAQAGIDELKKNIKNYDAAIIDGLFFVNSSQSGVPTSDKALFQVVTEIQRLASHKILPWFILSGQTSFTKEKNRYADGFDHNVYDKLNEDDLNSLWRDIKTAATNQHETQIRHKYKPAFDLCTDEYIGSDAEKSLLSLLETVEKRVDHFNTEDKLNSIRKIVEKLFANFHRTNILPDAIWNAPGNINNSSRFLSGKHPDYTLVTEIAPPVISQLLRNCLSFTQDGSHAEGNLNLKVNTFIKQQPTGYLFNSLVFQLLEVLAWSRTYFDTHKDYSENKNIAVLNTDAPEKQIIGLICQDEHRNYYCEGLLIPYNHINNNGYAVGDSIKVLRTKDNTSLKTVNMYHQIITASEKI
ncbi:MAG: hypothetical protein EOO46_00075 [Flavobacterium sp.]|nr:MAG: hypothetical protein EOO46_00075 [Flavobacterium sp.]